MCRCDALHFGTTCEYPLLATRLHLPPVHPSDEVHACLKAAIFWEGREELRTMIAANQGGSAERIVFENDITSALGVSVRSLVLALGSALQLARPIDFPSGWPLLSFPSCPSAHLSCYLEPFSPFSGSEPPSPTPRSVPQDPFLQCCRNMPVQYAEMAIPPQFRRKGAFWWMANVADMLVRPNRALSDMIRRAEKALGLEGRCIAVHARAGDACEHKEALSPVGGAIPGRTCFPPAHYLRAVRDMQSVYGDQDVYVASDSDLLIEQLRELGPDIRWRFLPHLNRSQFNSGLPFMLAARLALIDRQAAVESALLDLFLLSRCSALVAHFSSSFSVLALELIAARLGDIPPFIAVDGPLSLAYGPPLPDPGAAAAFAKG